MDVKSPNWVMSAVCDSYADALLEERPALFRLLEVLFEEHGCLQALLPAAPSDISLEAKAMCYDAGPPLRLLRAAGVEVPQWKVVDVSDCFARAVASMEGSGCVQRLSLTEAVSMVLGDERVSLWGSEAASLATLAVLKWSDAVALGLSQQSFLRRWTFDPVLIRETRATATAFPQSRGLA